jgi:hypothetical protein
MTLQRPPRAVLATAILFLLCASSSPADEQSFSFRVAWNNPFNPSQGEETRFEYEVFEREGPVRLNVFSADGRPVRRLADHVAPIGVSFSRTWDGRNDDGTLVDSGLYFAVLEAGDSLRKVRRVVVRRE